jgi:hypothetical protein
MSWTTLDVVPTTPFSPEFVIDDGASVPALTVNPPAVPPPTFSVPSGTYVCDTAGPTGSFGFIIGCVGYSLIWTMDDTASLDNITPTSFINDRNPTAETAGVFASPSGTASGVMAGQTKTIRARAINIDGRVSEIVSITITATQK